MRGILGTGRIAPLAVTVMGVSGVGKSTLGALLAGQMGCAFLEGDTFHSPDNVEKMRRGIALTDEDRWPWLDRLGAAVDEAVGQHGLAVAACSALRRCYRQRLAASAHQPMVFILLNASASELARRLEERPGHYMAPSLLSSQLATLELPEPDEPVLILNSCQDPQDLCGQAMEWINSRERETQILS